MNREQLIKAMSNAKRDGLSVGECCNLMFSAAEMLGADEHSISFLSRRLELLQKWQSKMRDPERTMVCDIIANGQTLEDVDPDRYKLEADGVPVVHMPHVWVVNWPSSKGGTKPVYHPSNVKPKFGEELDGKLTMYPVYTAPQPATAWQPIETAPKDGTYILLGSSDGSWVSRYHPVYQSGFTPENPWQSMMLNHDHLGRYPRAKPTHWMPLPPAPGMQPAIQERKPMTDEQIDRARCCATLPDGHGLPQSSDDDYVTWNKKTHVRAFARAIEAAHGITENGGAA